jgi:hypothetical protein
MKARFITRCGCEQYGEVLWPPPPFWLLPLRDEPDFAFGGEDLPATRACSVRQFDRIGEEIHGDERIAVYMEAK